MAFVDAVRACLSKYASFSGRARRAEYRWFVLIVYVALTAAASDELPGTDPLLVIAVYLGLMLPSIAAGVRRLHDTGRSGWWLLSRPIPVVGPFVVLVLLVLDSESGWNRWGAPTRPPWERCGTGQPKPARTVRSA